MKLPSKLMWANFNCFLNFLETIGIVDARNDPAIE